MYAHTHGGTNMRVEKIMTHRVTTCAPQDSLEHAASLMWNGDCGCLPVVSANGSGRIEGVITDRDVCMAALFQGRPLRDIRVEEAMAKTVLTCRASDEVEVAQRTMQNEQIRRLPVLGNEGELLGIVSMADLARESARLQYSQKHEIPASEVTATLAKISTRAVDRRAA
jgi:CBS-domain-containing membrane protein